MSQDYLGNPVSTTDGSVVAAIDNFVAGLLGYEPRAAGIIKVAAAAPDALLPNAYASALLMLMETPQGPVRARPFLDKALAAPGGNERERALLAFLQAWMGGDVPGALRISSDAVAAWPRDLVMLKLNHYLAFNVGDFPGMLRVAQAAAPAIPEAAEVHAMVAFACEQCHLLTDAEAAARRSLELKPSEPWAQHALAHVMLTQGRIDEGGAFMAGVAGGWTALNSFMATHNWWHLALFRLSQGRDAEVLAAYDDHCWAGDRDYSQDQVGAVSLLARLEIAGVDVGDRWESVADHLAKRGVDVELPFLSLQYLYGLARAGRAEAVPLLEAIRRQASTAPAYCRSVWADVAGPAAEGIVAYLAGDHGRAVSQLGRALPRLAEIGGSHAQRDLFHQIHLAAVLADGKLVDAQQACELRRVTDPDNVALNRTLARLYRDLGLPQQAAEAQHRAEARLKQVV